MPVRLQSMIDISQSEGLTLPTADYMRRFTEYTEQVRLHDEMNERENGGVRPAPPTRSRGTLFVHFRFLVSPYGR